MILKNVKSYKYARCFAKKSRKYIKKSIILISSIEYAFSIDCRMKKGVFLA